VGKSAAEAEQRVLASPAILPTRLIRVGIAPLPVLRMKARSSAMPTLHILFLP
jgi:hypothetical protein